MTALQTPAPDAHASEWGRLAVSLPGWRWMPGIQRLGRDLRCTDSDFFLSGHEAAVMEGCLPDPDDPATAGCLLALLGPDVNVLRRTNRTVVTIITDNLDFGHYPQGRGTTLGRACIAAAAAHGRWPGGAS